MNIGITGHQKLEDPTSWSWVEQTLRAELRSMPQPFTAVSCLAIGSDQLFARIAIEMGENVRAILPFWDIERTFLTADVAAFRALAQQAQVEVLPGARTDEEAYLVAGQRVAELSDLLFAVWDGRPARGRGGTADIVNYARLRRVPIRILDPILKTTS
jgi:hypothetical protein